MFHALHYPSGGWWSSCLYLFPDPGMSQPYFFVFARISPPVDANSFPLTDLRQDRTNKLFSTGPTPNASCTILRPEMNQHPLDPNRYAICENGSGNRSLWKEGIPPPPGWKLVTAFMSLPSAEGLLSNQSRINPKVRGDRLAQLPSKLPACMICPFRKEAPSHRLFCLPHAGSGASFYHFMPKLWKDEDIEVILIQYPGRESRIADNPATQMDDLIQSILGDASGILSRGSYSLFGHSMGALAAFELTHRIRGTSIPQPNHLFLSGRLAPDWKHDELPVGSMSDDAFLAEVGRRYNAIPPALLNNPDLLRIVLPSLRADFTLMHAYRYAQKPLLSVPIITLNGIQDPWIQQQGLDNWKRHTRGPVSHYSFEGDHFYMAPNASGIKSIIDNHIPQHSSDCCSNT